MLFNEYINKFSSRSHNCCNFEQGMASTVFWDICTHWDEFWKYLWFFPFFFWWHGYQAEGFPSTFIFCICSLLNEMLNFSWKLGKRKIFFSPTKLMLPLGSVRTLGIEHWFSMPIRNHWGCWRSSLSHASVGGSRGLSVLVTEESPLQALLMLSRIQGLGIMTPHTVGLTV